MMALRDVEWQTMIWLEDVGSIVAHASFIEPTKTPPSFGKGLPNEKVVDRRIFVVRVARKPWVKGGMFKISREVRTARYCNVWKEGD